MRPILSFHQNHLVHLFSLLVGNTSAYRLEEISIAMCQWFQKQIFKLN